MKNIKSFEELCSNFKEVYSYFSSVGDIQISDIVPEKTAHIAVDMINGFVKFGALSSPNVLAINEDIAKFSANCQRVGIMNIALCDSHPENCTEFETYPVHCIAGSAESALTDEIKASADFKVIPKLSVNGFLEEDFSSLILKSGLDTFIITGDCTDMCVLQLALTLKSALNRINRPSRVIVPYQLTATCTMPLHDPDFSELAALFIMYTNGIETVKNIKFENE